MTSKVTNIYINTTGFCDNALRRVIAATDVIVEHNGVEEYGPTCSRSHIAFDEFGEWDYCSSNCNQDAAEVGLWELESIAFRCKQEKKEEPLPTRNIYIDARTLTKEQRRKAFAVISSLAPFSTDWCVPNDDTRTMRDADFILYDLFTIDTDGDRVFIDDEINQTVSPFLVKPKELTYWELMSLAY